MNLLRIKDAELAYGTHHILHEANFSLSSGEKVALIGRNGTGKSTLLKIFAGHTALDDGERWQAQGIHITSLGQNLPPDSEHTIAEIVAEGLPKQAADHDWNPDYKVQRMLDLLNLPGSQTIAASSGGVRRRAMLARAMVGEPDVLLLDEPTNHLDIESIEILQKTLSATTITLVFVSHDRTLINALATRIVELDRGQLTSYPGNFAKYLDLKAKADAEEATANRKFDQMLAEEETWIRQGIKARRTRNEGRVRRLEKLRQTRAARLNKQGNARLVLDTAEASGDIVAVLDNVSFGYDKPLIRNFSAQIMRGDRIAIIGPNGSGKSTLVRLILGELEPSEGSISRGTKLQTAYFDQERSALDENLSVRDNVSPASDHVEVNGRSKHVVGYLADFLFPAAVLNMPIKKLSGGEKNRLLMAKLFTQPANLLVLDEPTNDLDMETLELFEELLAEYTGTILLISHDRAFIDAVATSTFVFSGDGTVGEYVGGFSDWQRQTKSKTKSPQLAAAEIKSDESKQSKAAAKLQKKRLGYKAQRELDGLPELIETLEVQQERLQAAVSDPNFYQQDEQTVKDQLEQLKQLDTQIEQAYARWEELSALEP